MCGIAGLIRYDGRRVAPELLERAGRSLAHRGPDDHGFLCWNGNDSPACGREAGALGGGPVGLVHRRLSILDLSEAGWQPMSSSDNRYHIVFNGEIYNYLELRDELTAFGHGFITNSDTEVLLAAYSRWGKSCLERLVGMFAFAVLDIHDRSIFLARDFFGIKPLFWHSDGNRFAFASEIKGLAALGVSLKLEPQGVFEYMQDGCVRDADRTIYEGIKSLPAAHFMTIPIDSPAQAAPQRYWQIETDEVADVSFEEASQTVRFLFLQNLGLHMRSDVPLGSALSGGIDSSAIVAGMRSLSDGDLHSVSFIAEKGLSEEVWMDSVTKATGVNTHKVRIGSTDLAHDMDALVEAQDEPFLGTSMYAQFRVMRHAREKGLSVMLDGQGADEILGGYTHYLGIMVASLLRRLEFFAAARCARAALGLPGVYQGTMAASATLKLAPAWVSRWLRRAAGRTDIHPWINRKWFADRGVVFEPAIGPSRSQYILREELKASLERDLPHLLRFEDRNSMAFSVESRTPFLTPELVQFLFSLPEEYLIDANATTKSIFRTAMRGIVPDEVLDRRDKMGFPTPERHWLASIRPQMASTLGGDVAQSFTGLVPEYRREWETEMKENISGSMAWRCYCLLRGMELKGTQIPG